VPDIIYASDGQWWDAYLEEWSAIDCERWTSHQAAADKYGLQHIPRKSQHHTLADGMVSGGGNSGHEAVSLAYHLGASEIVLLGFDMRSKDGMQHFHGNHGRRLTNPTSTLYRRWITRMQALVADIRSRGVAVTNETPGSALRL